MKNTVTCDVCGKAMRADALRKMRELWMAMEIPASTIPFKEEKGV